MSHCKLCPHTLHNHNHSGCRKRGGPKGCGCTFDPLRERTQVLAIRTEHFTKALDKLRSRRLKVLAERGR